MRLWGVGSEVGSEERAMAGRGQGLSGSLCPTGLL